MNQCKGYNCKSTDGANHSFECILQHNSALHSGAGNKHPESRYAGYKGNEEPASDIVGNEEKRAAWWEGFMARADT
jgi:hypothetical protein